MSKQKAKSSNFWKPKTKGESISGKYLGFFEGQYGVNLKLKTKSGEKYLRITTFLKNIFSGIYEDLTLNKTVIAITYEGKQKRKTKVKGQTSTFNSFTVYVDNKEIKSGMQELDKNKLNSYFDEE